MGISSVKTKRLITPAEFDRMLEQGDFDAGRRIELIRGELRRLSPTAIRHRKTLDVLQDWSRDEGAGRVKWRLREWLNFSELDSVPEPDLVWVDRRPYGGRRPTAADVRLIVEVAGASLRYDRTTKARLYAEAGVEDYWIVNVPGRCLEVLRDPAPEGYRRGWTLDELDTIAPLDFPGLRLDVGELFARYSDED